MSIKKLRFAALIRVSTEQQEKVGESLQTQRTENQRSAKQLGGSIVEWYGGQEHATPGFEKKEVERLLQDAAKGKFDAVMVANADRWSRDNIKAQSGLDQLQKHKVRFFVSITEYDLFNPEHVLFLGMSAVIGRFQAQHQNRKSMLNRIERAKRGVPTSGKLPYGRTFDRKTEVWGIDKEKQALIQDVAKRYLAGEAIPTIASELGVNHASLHKTLTKRCGTEWEIGFECADLNIKETVVIAIPPLLDSKTIKAIQKTVIANKTYNHGQAKNPYLFTGFIFCRHCGYGMFGQTNKGDRAYYRHAHTKRERDCPFEKGWVHLRTIEATVMDELFRCFGNPVAVQRAIDEATPNLDKINGLRDELIRVDETIAKTKSGRAKLLRALEAELAPEEEVMAKLSDLKDREAKQHMDRERLMERIGNIPTPEAIKQIAKQFADRFGRQYADTKLVARKRLVDFAYEEMSWQEKRQLVEMVFNGVTLDGRRMGIYIEWPSGRGKRGEHSWRYAIEGVTSLETREGEDVYP